MSCESCLGGWIIVQRAGVSAAEQCRCVTTKIQANPPLSESCIRIAHEFLRSVPFAPKEEPEAEEFLSAWLAKRLTSEGELRRFRVYVHENLTTWTGVAGLLLLLNSFREASYAEREAKETTLRIAEAKQQAQLNPCREPLQLPPVAPKRLPPPNQVILPRPDKLHEAEDQLREEMVPPWSEEERNARTRELEAAVHAHTI